MYKLIFRKTEKFYLNFLKSNFQNGFTENIIMPKKH